LIALVAACGGTEKSQLSTEKSQCSTVCDQAYTKFDDAEAIQKNNVASGIHWGLSLCSLGLILSRSIYLSQSLVVFVVWFCTAIPMLLAVNKGVQVCLRH